MVIEKWTITQPNEPEQLGVPLTCSAVELAIRQKALHHPSLVPYCGMFECVAVGRHGEWLVFAFARKKSMDMEVIGYAPVEQSSEGEEWLTMLRHCYSTFCSRWRDSSPMSHCGPVIARGEDDLTQLVKATLVYFKKVPAQHQKGLTRFLEEAQRSLRTYFNQRNDIIHLETALWNIHELLRIVGGRLNFCPSTAA